MLQQTAQLPARVRQSTAAAGKAQASRLATVDVLLQQLQPLHVLHHGLLHSP
jgi:hypothetical protein